MVKFYKSSIFLMMISILCSCDNTDSLPKNFNNKEKDFYCAGIFGQVAHIQKLYANKDMSGFLNTIGNLLDRKYGLDSSPQVKSIVQQGVNEISYYCRDNAPSYEQNKCQMMLNDCLERMKNLSQTNN